MRTSRATISVALAAAAAALVVGCSPAPGDEQGDFSSSGQWSVTLTITNNSATDLTVTSVRADNGGSVVAGHPTSIPANSPPATFRAINSGNGVQMWITLTGPDGQNLVVDSDVPHTDTNWSTAEFTGTTTGLSTGAISIGGGDNPTAAFTIDPCPQGRCTTSSTTEGGPNLGGAGQ